MAGLRAGGAHDSQGPCDWLGSPGCTLMWTLPGYSQDACRTLGTRAPDQAMLQASQGSLKSGITHWSMSPPQGAEAV